MKFWPFNRRQQPSPSLDAEAASNQAYRALTDARNLDGRADRVAVSLAEIVRTNHIAAAVAKTIRET